MNKVFIFILFSQILVAQKSQMAKEIEMLKLPEIEWKVPEVGVDIERVVLPSGATIYIKEENKLPLVNISIYLKNSGPPYLEYGEYLVWLLLKEMILKGGTEKYSPIEITKLLETNAIDISIEDYNGFTRIDCSFLSNLTDLAIPILEEILYKPRFDEDILKIEKERVIDTFKRYFENPSSALYYFKDYILYSGHPASCHADINKIKNLDKDRLIQIHRIFFKPSNMVISVIGDFKKDEFIEKIEHVFCKKYNNSEKIPELIEMKPMEKNKVFFYDLKIPQGYILILHEGPNGYTSSYFDLLLMNEILGSGGFTSRIVSKVRNEKGLAYSTYGFYDVLNNFKGYFSAFSATKSDAVYDAIYYIIEEVKNLKETMVKEDELRLAKESLINSLITRLGNPYNFIQRIPSLELTNRPIDFYSKYNENVKKVGAEGVLNAAKFYLKPEDVSIIVVGDKSKIDTLKLKEFGEIEFLKVNF